MSLDPSTPQRVPVVPGPVVPGVPPTAVFRSKPLVSPLIVVLVVASVIGLVLGAAVAGDLAREPSGRRPATAGAAPDPATVSFASLSDQQWRLIAAKPGAHAGAAIVVFGSVTEAGFAGGAVRVRAGGTRSDSRAGGKRTGSWTDALLTGDELLLDGLAVNDEFTAKVIVSGGATVPRLEVRHIEIV
jgi:hypothetical protein